MWILHWVLFVLHHNSKSLACRCRVKIALQQFWLADDGATISDMCWMLSCFKKLEWQWCDSSVWLINVTSVWNDVISVLVCLITPSMTYALWQTLHCHLMSTVTFIMYIDCHRTYNSVCHISWTGICHWTSLLTQTDTFALKNRTYSLMADDSVMLA